MHVEPDIPFLGTKRFACVKSHPHPHRAGCECELRVGGRCHGVRCTSKRDEERIALGVDLDSIVPRPRISQCTTVVRKHFRVRVAKLL